MKIYNVSNNNINPSFKANEDEAKKFVDSFKNIKQEFKDSKTPEIEAARKRLMSGNGTDADKKIINDYIGKLKEIKGNLNNTTKEFKEKGKPELDKLPNWIKTIYEKYSKTGLVKYLSSKGAKGLTIALAAGNVMKEIVGGLFYTLQAMTNEDLPKDKRKFVGMYDLIVGAISATLSAGFGILAVTCQDRILGKLLKKNSGAKYSKYATAYAGLTFLIPNLLQTIIGKRIIAPAMATPIAGSWKQKQLDKQAAQKAQQTA